MRVGVDAMTGRMLAGWDHVVQSIGKCLRLRIGTRVMRRHLGSNVPELQDQNADPMTIMALYVSIAEALNDPDGGEPGFNLKTIEMVEFGRSGRFGFLLEGDYFPAGHLGDFSLRQGASTTLAAGALIS